MFSHFFHQIHFFSVFFHSVFIFPLKILCFIYIVGLISKAYSEPCQTSKMGLFVKIVNDFMPLSIFAKFSVLYIWQDSEYSSGYYSRGFGAIDKVCQHIFIDFWPPTTKSHPCSCGHKFWRWYGIFQQRSDFKYPFPPHLPLYTK